MASALRVRPGPVTSVREQLGVARGRDHLRVQSDRIRSELDDSRTSEWDDGIDLSSVGTIQQLYEAGAVLGRAYDFGVLPPAEQLTGDLERLFDLYEAAIDVKRRLLLREPGVILAPTRQPATGDHGDGELAFRPKPDGSYTVVIQGGQRRQSRRHETLVRAFGEACIARGLTVGTNVHPEDAEVRTSSRCWVAEMKAVKPGGELQAVRDAHAQLEMYVDLLHDAVDEPSKVAVFDRPVGDAWVGYLARRGIETVWRESGAWYGTPDATADGLATHALDAGRYALALARPTMARRR